MTGRDLIVYILTNKLEDEDVFKNGTFLDFLGFLPIQEVSERMGVGVATINALIRLGKVSSLTINNTVYVSHNLVPRKEVKDVQVRDVLSNGLFNRYVSNTERAR